MISTTNLLRVLAAGLLWLAAVGASAQATSGQPIQSKSPRLKEELFRGEVIHATRVAITVRSRTNYNLVRTFTYNQKLGTQVGKQMDANKLYGFGDRVEITYLAGTDTAVKIKRQPGQKQGP
ncbi:MAG: hypothetical protein ACRD35_07870 [Candidatus Acidiferrales bacterium]